ncbi:MAG: D-2-hydroxyacid dehydrogenase [Planctomycetes bacterium]|nr:D-2-hydroxyacid dehydrogenase [Planctomycetota bacterium]
MREDTLVVYPPLDPDRLARVAEAAGSMRVINATDLGAARRAMPEADAFYGKITADLLAAATRLRWIQSPTASLEHYMFPELIGHPAVLTNMRGLFSDVIADQVMGYVICFARNLHIYIRNQVDARWEPLGGDTQRASSLIGPSVVTEIDRSHRHLGDQTLGVVGLGCIGSEIARRAGSFGMRVLAVDALRRERPSEVDALWPVEEIDRLLGESDYVVIAAPQTPRTVGMFHRAVFGRMRPTAFLINIGRGAIVRLDDLVAALDAREIAGAALDVYEQEPLPSDHPLWRFPNVILTPHIAGYSPRVPERHLETLVDNVRRFALGQPLRNVVTKAEWC